MTCTYGSPNRLRERHTSRIIKMTQYYETGLSGQANFIRAAVISKKKRNTLGDSLLLL